MKKFTTLALAMLSALFIHATTIKLKITYQGNPVTDCDVTVKQGSLELGTERTNRSGEVSIDTKNLVSKSIDVYGKKKTSNGEKTWNVNGSVVLDDDNFAHMKMEEYAKQMADASGISESTIAGMWGLALGGENTSGTGSSSSSTASSSSSSKDDEEEKEKSSKPKKSLLERAENVNNKIANAPAVSVKTETHSSYSHSGPDGSYGSSSSSKSETSFGGGSGVSHSSSKTKSSLDDGGFKSTREDKETKFGNDGVSHSNKSSKTNGKFDEDGIKADTDQNEGGVSLKSKSKDSSEEKSGSKKEKSGNSGNSSSSSSTASNTAPPVDPEMKKLEQKKQEHELTIAGFNKQIVDQQATLMALKAEEEPDTITIGYKENDLETVKLKKEQEEIALERVNARIAKTDITKEKEQQYMDRETQIAFRLKQLEELEKKTKDLRKDEKDRREEREKRLKEKHEAAEKEAKEEANFDTYSKTDLKFRLIDLKRRLGVEQANNKTTIDKEKKAESTAKIEKLKAKIDRYEKRIAELEAKEAAEKGAKEEKKN